MTAPKSERAETAWTALEWREMGGQLMLVSCGGGAKVALCARGSMLHTRDPELGILRLLRPDDEIARLIVAMPELAEALAACKRMIDEALPKFNWGASFLDADAIRLLNETPGLVNAALARIRGEAL